jgi:hypothetical protein
MQFFSFFGAKANDPGFDNTPCLIDAYDNAREKGDFDLRFGQGIYSFNTPVPEFNSTLRLQGVSQNHTDLRREYVETDPQRGFITFRDVGQVGPWQAATTIRASAITDMSISAGPKSTGGMLVLATTDGVGTGWFHMRHVKLTHDNAGGSYARALQIDGRKNLKPGGQGFRDAHIERVFAWAPKDFDPNRPLVAFLNCNSLKAEIWCSGLVLLGGLDVPFGKITNAIVTLQGCRTLVTNAERLTTYGYLDTLTHGPGAHLCRHYGGVGTYANTSGSNTNVVV